jgi:hypothetical protein
MAGTEKTAALPTEEQTGAPRWWIWLNSNRLIIVLSWALSTWALFSALPPLARPLTSIAAAVVAVVARDRILATFFGLIALGILAVGVFLIPV